jgi:cell division septation protein DedD
MPAENGMPENDDVKKKALLRLAVAGVVTTAALGGLWWLDKNNSEPKKPLPEASAPTPIVAAPSPEVSAPETPPDASAQTPEPPAPSASQPTDQIAPAPASQPVESPPPPKVSNAPRTPSQLAAPTPASKPIPVPPQPSAAPPPQAMPAPGKGFVVQLGVFSNPDNARELVEKLNKQGVRAHLEARVQIGPFLNRQEAEKAQMEMRKLGYNALVTLPYSVATTVAAPAATPAARK